ncbi:MAG: serine hydrolase domain-containing protein [Pseudomonadales bacterium]
MLAAKLWQQARDNSAPAMGLLIFRAGEQQLGGICGAGVSSSTSMRFGSITKTFTALTLLTLARDGLVDLQQPVAQLLPKAIFNNPWSATAPLRVRHLLELSAGLPDLSAPEWNNAKPISLAQALTLDPRKRRLLWPPGLQHSYSNSVPGISQVLIEKFGNAALEPVMQRQVFAPLGMSGASLSAQVQLPGGYQADGKTPIPYWHMSFPAFGALNATLSDMSTGLRWLIMQGCQWQRDKCRHGTPSNAATDALRFKATDRRALFEPNATAAAAAGLQVGYAAGIYPRIRFGTVFYGHGGDADGYRSRYGFDPRSGHGYLVVINSDNPSLLGRLVKQLERHLATPRREPRLAPTPKAAEFSGRYYPSSARFDVARWRRGEATEVRVSLGPDQLLFTKNARQTILLPVAGAKLPGAALFRRADDPVASVAFTTTLLPGSAVPATLLQGELGNYVRVAPGACPPIFPFCDSQ